LNGKCLDVKRKFGISRGNELIQSSHCSRLISKWNWNYNNQVAPDRHICHVFYGCVASPQNYGGNTLLIKWGWLNEAGQRFTFKQDKATGYFRIVNDHGKCLAVAQNSKKDGAGIYAWDCNTDENGQLWKWY